MKTRKMVLLASAAVVAMGLGLSSEAQAFDRVNWEWDKTVTENVLIDIDVDADLDLSGLTEVEKLQVNIGDITAESIVSDIDNNPPGEASGTAIVTIQDTIEIDADYNEGTGPQDNPVDPLNSVVTSQNGIVGTVVSGNVDEGTNSIDDLIVDLSGEEIEVDISDIELTGVNNAVDLPAVESAATALANNQNIESTVGVTLHDGQFNFGGFATLDDADTEEIEGNLDAIETAVGLAAIMAGADVTDNSNLDTALGLTLAGALGIITQGEVAATSTVDTISNATVDSSATALGNNISVDVDAVTAADAFVIADITQWNYANVTATSDVSGVDINNYSNLGALEIPVVSSVATSIGNNASISVSSPVVVDVPTPGTGGTEGGGS